MKKILVVDDDEMLRTLMRTVLSIDGLEVRAVGSGKDALKAIKADTPDLIICDARMPEMSGAELLAAVRRRDAWKAIPFLFVTGKSSWELDKQVDGGNNTYLLQKPFDPEDLFKAVDKVLPTG